MPTKSELEQLNPSTLGGLSLKPASETTTYINMMVYGDPGVGKTRFCGSACKVPSLSPVLVVDVEGGTMSLADDYGDVSVVRVDSWEDMAAIYGTLYDDPKRFRTVVIDSLTEMQKFSMDRIMDKLHATRSDRYDAQDGMPGMREWGINGEQIRKLVRAFRDMDINFLCTALAMTDVTERTGIRKIKPSLSGKLKNEVSGFLDIVGYYYRKEVKLGDSTEKELTDLLLTGGTEKQIAKDRSGKLPNPIPWPTMEKLHEHIKGAK